MKTKKKCEFIGRSYRNYNREIVQQSLIDENWTEFENGVKSFKFKQEKEPWISNHLIELIKDKDYALNRAKKKEGPSTLGWSEKIEEQLYHKTTQG